MSLSKYSSLTVLFHNKICPRASGEPYRHRALWPLVLDTRFSVSKQTEYSLSGCNHCLVFLKDRNKA